MSAEKYAAFLKTVELGSLTAAAQTLGYTQSGVSHILLALEKELDVTLLLRDRSGVQITSEGLRLLPLMQRVCDAENRLRQTVDQLHGLESGLIRIGAFSSVSVHWLPAILQQFQQKHPGIAFQLLLGEYQEIQEWVLDGRVDCGFTSLPVGDSRLETYFIKEDPFVAIVPQSHPLCSRQVFPLAQAAVEPFIKLEEGRDQEIQPIFSERQIHPNVRYTVRDDYAIIAMVESGLGVSILPELLLRRSPYRIAVLPLDQPVYRRLGLVSRSLRQVSPAAAAFIGHVLQWAKKELAGEAQA